MPKTKFQKLIFGIIMAFFMVYGMEVYNAILRNGILSFSDFLIPIRELLLLIIIVMLLETVVGGPLARNLAFKFINPETTKPLKVTLVISIMTVICMCPMMSLVATILFKGFDNAIYAKWLKTFEFNFPMAFIWQMLIAGPIVRFIFTRIFEKPMYVGT